MRKTDLAYLAGFMDGEGAVMLSLNPSGGLQVAVSVSQNTSTVLELYVKAFGGHVYEHKPKNRNSSMFQWRANGLVAIEALLQMKPWLLVKLWATEQALYVWSIRDDKATVREFVTNHKATVKAERESR